MKTISMNFFIDAFGWEMNQENPFLPDLLPHRYPLKSIYGYSSACVPSILFGTTPSVHGFWSTFFYSPETSPFKFLSPLSIIPKLITHRSKIRHQINKYVRKRLQIEGYFNLYQFPFNKLKYFDYNEKINFYRRGSAPVPSLFDRLAEHQIPYYTYSVEKKEQDQWIELEHAIRQNQIRFSYVSLGRIDSLLHLNTRTSPVVIQQLNEYAHKIRRLYELAQQHYESVTLNIFSDHDMAPITGSIDLMQHIDRLDIDYGTDYIGVYDSTMARFWFLNKPTEVLLRNKLSTLPGGHIMTPAELSSLGTYFEDHKYGELIFQLDEGLVINPCFMGNNVISGMHGYLPHHRFSSAAWLSNHAPNPLPQRITDIHHLLLASVGEK